MVYPVLKRTPSGDQAPPRREVDDWWYSAEANKDLILQKERQKSLFVRALTNFQLRDPLTDQLSYYQIAGKVIHSPSPIRSPSHTAG